MPPKKVKMKVSHGEWWLPPSRFLLGRRASLRKTWSPFLKPLAGAGVAEEDAAEEAPVPAVADAGAEAPGAAAGEEAAGTSAAGLQGMMHHWSKLEGGLPEEDGKKL
jgi:hypothetical protein